MGMDEITEDLMKKATKETPSFIMKPFTKMIPTRMIPMDSYCTSERMDQILPALQKLRRGIGFISKDKEAVIKLKSGGIIKYNHSDINSVINAIYPYAEECDLLIMQPPATDSLKVTRLNTTIWHVPSEQFISAGVIIEVGQNDMQDFAGDVTSLRRYVLISMLGLSQEDPDGARKPVNNMGEPLMNKEDALEILTKAKERGVLERIFTKYKVRTTQHIPAIYYEDIINALDKMPTSL